MARDRYWLPWEDEYTVVRTPHDAIGFLPAGNVVAIDRTNGLITCRVNDGRGRDAVEYLACRVAERSGRTPDEAAEAIYRLIGWLCGGGGE